MNRFASPKHRIELFSSMANSIIRTKQLQVTLSIVCCLFLRQKVVEFHQFYSIRTVNKLIPVSGSLLTSV